MAGFEGGCACGQVRYRLTSAPMFVNCCHCRDCQRQTGGAFAINALIETDRIELTAGKPRAANRTWFTAARPARPRCGATMAAAR
jgi:hypothetical protein